MQHNELEAIVCAILTVAATPADEQNPYSGPANQAVHRYQQILTAMRQAGGPLKTPLGPQR